MKTLTFVLAGLITASLPAFAKTPSPARANRADYIAHEWGTFTSVQGSDGLQLEWNPFVPEELPRFVYDIAKPVAQGRRASVPGFQVFGKRSFVSRQRMETPVIYFYSDKRQTVDVSVDFPGGRFTEWYPQLAAPEQLAAPKQPARQLAQIPAASAALRWANVEIMPGNGADEAQFFPKDETGSHYYAARETDASGIRVKGGDGKTEHEKFLFYRGVAQFQAPLTVNHYGDHAERIALQNTSKDKLGSFFIYAVRGGKAAMIAAPAMDAGGRNDLDFHFEKIARPLAEVRAELAEQMRRALVSEGLYAREAAAMVKTWDDAWFAEQGTRVLYLLPQKWSDAVLPLKLSPAPRELKRVFVGRAELITPAQEWAVLKEVTRYAEGGSLQRKDAVAAVANLSLGRFTDAVARKLQLQGPQAKDYYQNVWSLLDATRPAPRADVTASALR